jgi:SAM-dependent methyltransferase
LSELQRRFGAQAGEYSAFRPVWPREVFTRILARAGEPRRCAVDLGAGTGLVTARLVEHFGEVVAVEPDERMLARLAPDPAVRVIVARAEEADFDHGRIDLVTAGNAFHWMEGAAVCARIHEWLRPGGVLAVFRYDPPHAAAGALEELLHHEYSVVWRAHVHPRLHDPDYTRRTVAESRFGPTLEASWIANDLELSFDELLGFLRSTSYGGGHARSLADPEDYWRELGRRVRAAAGRGPFVLDFAVELLLASKEPA